MIRYNRLIMLHIITGKKNAGKTTKIREILEKKPEAHGFYAEKVVDCGRVTTYNMVDVQSGEKETLARLASLPLLKNWEDDFLHGPFRFSYSGFQWAMERFEQAQRMGAQTFFIDELGKLELNGKGHAPLIEKALQSQMTLYIAIRDINVNAAIEKFSIQEHVLIATENE